MVHCFIVSLVHCWAAELRLHFAFYPGFGYDMVLRLDGLMVASVLKSKCRLTLTYDLQLTTYNLRLTTYNLQLTTYDSSNLLHLIQLIQLQYRYPFQGVVHGFEFAIPDHFLAGVGIIGVDILGEGIVVALDQDEDLGLIPEQVALAEPFQWAGVGNGVDERPVQRQHEYLGSFKLKCGVFPDTLVKPGHDHPGAQVDDFVVSGIDDPELQALHLFAGFRVGVGRDDGVLAEPELSPGACEPREEKPGGQGEDTNDFGNCCQVSKRHVTGSLTD